MAKKAKSKQKPAKSARATSRPAAAKAKPRPKPQAKSQSKPQPKPKPKTRVAKPTATKIVDLPPPLVPLVAPRPAAGGPPTVGLRVAGDPDLKTGTYTFSPSDWQISEATCDPLTGFASGEARLVVTAKFQRDPDEQS